MGQGRVDGRRPGNNRRSFLRASAVGTIGAVTASASASRFLGQVNEIQASVVSHRRQVRNPADQVFQELAQDYSLDPAVRYLNHASIGCMPIPVQKARAAYLELCESNPWLHMWGDAWHKPLQQARESAADLMGCPASDMAITHNTTEMFNTLANGLPLEQNDEVLFSSLCHAGASIPFLVRSEWGAYQARRFDFPMDGLPDISIEKVIEAYEREIKPNTRALIIPHIDNTLGIRYPVREMAAMARRKGVDFVAVDAAQTVGMITVNCSDMKVDAVSTSGHKWIGGPKGTGLAYVGESMQQTLKPLWVTWGQRSWSDSARKFEDYGTRNLAEALTLHDAIEFGKRISVQDRTQRLQELWTFTRELVEKEKSLSWTSPNQWQMGGSLYSIRVTQPAAKLAKRLFEEHDIVLRPFTNMGLNNLRVSPNVFTTRAEIEQLVGLIR